MSHEAIELLSHVCFGSNHDRFLVQAVGIETFRLGEQCGHLVRKSRANSLWAAPWSALCAFDQGRYLVKPCSQYAAERRALATASLGELADRVAALPGVTLLNDSFFNEFTVRLPKPAAPVVEALAGKRILAGVPASRLLPG